MRIAEKTSIDRRNFLIASVTGAAGILPLSSIAADTSMRFDRAAYDRYIRLMNAADLEFVDYYTDDIKFVMGLHGKASVLRFYAAQRSYVKEELEVLFFCSDATGAAAMVHSEIRCIQDCDNTSIFGRALKAGEVQQVRGYLFYKLNDYGKIVEIAGPPPEILQPWHMAEKLK